MSMEYRRQNGFDSDGKPVWNYRGGEIVLDRGFYFPNFLGVFVTPDHRPSKTPVAYATLDEAEGALDGIEVMFTLEGGTTWKR